jgi:hypothetical protein
MDHIDQIFKTRGDEEIAAQFVISLINWLHGISKVSMEELDYYRSKLSAEQLHLVRDKFRQGV